MSGSRVLARLAGAMTLVLMTLTPGVTSLTPEELDALTRDGMLTFTLGPPAPQGYYQVTSRGIPNHQTGDFPNPENPNDIVEQDHSYIVPVNPVTAAAPSCLPPGPIGLSSSGAPFFNPYTIEECDAVTGECAEVFDQCDGHPDINGVYHYHQLPGCIEEASQSDGVVGIAFDGYPIYSKYASDGSELTSADLDDCHGRMVDGAYRYHLTEDFPYVLGCFTGEVHPTFEELQQGPDCNFAIPAAQKVQAKQATKKKKRTRNLKARKPAQ